MQWLAEYDIDGFRVDHAIGADMNFYVALRHAMRTVKPDSFTVGEVTDSPDATRRYHGKLNAVLDFPLAHALPPDLLSAAGPSPSSRHSSSPMTVTWLKVPAASPSSTTTT